MDASFMSESIYEKLPSPSTKSLRHRSASRDSQTGACEIVTYNELQGNVRCQSYTNILLRDL